MRQYAARRTPDHCRARLGGRFRCDQTSLRELLEAARRREIDVVLVWLLNRKTGWRRLRSRSILVGFVALTEALDLTPCASWAVAGLLARTTLVRF